MSSRSTVVSGSLGPDVRGWAGVGRRAIARTPRHRSGGVVAESPCVDGSIAPPARPLPRSRRLAAPALAPR